MDTTSAEAEAERELATESFQDIADFYFSIELNKTQRERERKGAQHRRGQVTNNKSRAGARGSPAVEPVTSGRRRLERGATFSVFNTISNKSVWEHLAWSP